MPDVHARLSPSAAHRWMRCPSSLAESENCDTGERKSSAYADEGTAAHQLAERVLREELLTAKELEGELADNGVLYDEEMCEYVDKYVKAVREYSEGHQLHIEQRVDFSHAVGQPDCFGTSDAVVLTADGLELQLHDLKFGRGVQVYAKENEQLMLYALGALRQFDLLGEIDTVRLVIHQPRLAHLDEWTVSVTDLRKFAAEARAAAARAIDLADNGTAEHLLANYNAGAKQCKFCPVKATCPAQLKLAATSMGARFDDLIGGNGKEEAEKAIVRTAQLTNDELAALMPMLDTIVDWTKAVRAKVESELLAGREVKGFKLVEGKRGPRTWSNEQAVEEMLKAMRFRNDEMYNMKLHTPTVIEKMLKDNPTRWNKVAEHITQSNGSPSVAPLSDKRPALVLESDLSDLLGKGE